VVPFLIHNEVGRDAAAEMVRRKRDADLEQQREETHTELATYCRRQGMHMNPARTIRSTTGAGKRASGALLLPLRC
jgi:hypothetical protein